MVAAGATRRKLFPSHIETLEVIDTAASPLETLTAH